MNGRAMTVWARCDTNYGGNGQITGKITEKWVAGSYRVRLYDQLTGRCIRETWSAGNGAYEFTWINQRPKYVIAFDHTSPVQIAVIKDNVIPS